MGETNTKKTVFIRVDRRPGQCTVIANDIAIDDVADAPEELPGGCKHPASIQRYQWIDTLDPGPPEDYRNDEEDSSKESHPALPGGEDMPGLSKVVRDKIGLLHHEVHPSTNPPSHHRPPQHPLHFIPRDPPPCCIASTA